LSVVGTVHPDVRNVAATLAARPRVRVAFSTVTGVERSTAPAGGLLEAVPDVGVPAPDVGVAGVVVAVDPVVGLAGGVPCDCEPVSSVPLDWMLEAVDRVSAQAPRPMTTTARSTARVGRRSRQGPRCAR
jgi:hypothetical protein